MTANRTWQLDDPAGSGSTQRSEPKAAHDPNTASHMSTPQNQNQCDWWKYSGMEASSEVRRL